MNSHFETPDALRHDAHTLADDARALLHATSDIADEKVAEARRRLETALANAKDLAQQAGDRAKAGLRTADAYVRENPYPSIAVAFGLGAVLSLLLATRRN